MAPATKTTSLDFYLTNNDIFIIEIMQLQFLLKNVVFMKKFTQLIGATFLGIVLGLFSTAQAESDSTDNDMPRIYRPTDYMRVGATRNGISFETYIHNTLVPKTVRAFIIKAYAKTYFQGDIVGIDNSILETIHTATMAKIKKNTSLAQNLVGFSFNWNTKTELMNKVTNIITDVCNAKRTMFDNAESKISFAPAQLHFDN